MSPTVVIGDNALNADAAVVAPVPPFATAKVPPNVSVPLVVIGPPLSVNPVDPPDPLTLVTVPLPAVVHVGVPAPFEVSTCPDVPTDVNAYPVPVPYDTVPAVGAAVLFVPPFAIGNVPEISAVNEIALHVGADAPVDFKNPAVPANLVATPPAPP